MSKRILNIIFIFVVGMVGGIFSSQFLLPHLLEDNFMGFDSNYLAKMASGPIYLTEKKEITLEENSALQGSVQAVKDVVVFIKTEINGKTLTGSGLILTNDGLIVTLNELVPRGGASKFFVEEEAYNGKILKRDSEKNLALIKIEGNNFKTTSFANFEQVNAGERFFLFGKVNFGGERVNLVNEGIIKYLTSEHIKTNITEDVALGGSSLFNVKGEFLGLNTIDKEGSVLTILAGTVADFAGF
jgi:uncharacterized protein YlaN (UPF0358 family)